ncbi:MAG: RNB domain-containing ribonuclease, partial [Gallionellaceae bacterium]|nr:RNB domain-containing ribonuclease [Gallionellaceae bacterium]
MNIFYEEDGGFKAGAVLADNNASLQVENLHGKRSKVKAANVMLRFAQPGLAEFMAQAEGIAADMDVEFLWECCPPDEFGFDTLASEYFGHAPAPAEAAGALIRLHSAPMYFYKKGKGRYKAAPPDALKAALASAEKKRLLAELQARYTEQLCAFALPPEFAEKLPQLLYRPDRNTVETKALEAACAATHLSAAHLLERCGAIPSTQDFHLQRFLFEHFPQGTGFPDVSVDMHPELPLAEAEAFSIDDASTTEIDDAFTVTRRADGNWRIGVHIAAPALCIAPDSPVDAIAAHRLSTVYMPGDKITMLPDNVVQSFTLSEDTVCPALSMYLDVDANTLEILASESRIERIHIATNLKHDTLEPLFNEESLAAGRRDYPYAEPLALLWQFAHKLEALRGKPADTNAQQTDFTFLIENDRVIIEQRRRGSPIDKVVSELMIYVNSEWGRLLAERDISGIYRAQNNGKVKMSTVPAPHQGLGVAQYLWASSPLRRYVDMINQRQIAAMVRDETPPYAKNDPAMFAAMRDFDAAYTAYADFQRSMERYWCLRWLLQEQVTQVEALVLRENLVRFTRIPLVGRIPALPELPPNTRVTLEITRVDLLDLEFSARYVG